MNWTLLEDTDLDSGGVAVLRDSRAEHLRSVTRVKPGDLLRVGRVNGPRGRAEVLAVGADAVTLRCSFDAEPPPRPRVDLLLALPRPKVLRRLWSPLAQLGVGRVVLTNASGVERNYFDTHWLSPAHYRPLLREGLEQVGDTWFPEVEVCREFRPFVEDRLEGCFGPGLRLLADPGAPAGPTAWSAETAPGARCVVAVGPETGWTDFERDLLKGRGFKPFGLGPRALRSDVACIGILCLVHEWLRSHT